MKILVTGANGQLGKELVQLNVRPGIHILGYGRDNFDITNSEQCADVVKAYRPDVIIHCAAYTAVDKAESDADEAYRINAWGTRNVAMAAKACGAKLCYISTDYVFDGKGNEPYEIEEPTNPQTVYGQTKLAGELEVAAQLDRYYIVRTSWVYGKYGNNFVRTILKLASERDRLKVVRDQIGSPTYTLDLAVFLIELVQTDKYGVYHASNTGSCSWFEFAQEIVRSRDGANATITLEPCSTAEFPRPAARPAYSVMSHAAIERAGLQDLRPWREALAHYMKHS
ncbi:dTDP-4-dehydrorhamnose reductase [Paenibacillus lignilyticus]|uniref:dTDP-4-dehydrorhamnose reductase n=1 Tax=Paenibacillus lignilyticus TaxID=1172615 RepID=A0ABS5CMB3_9BACL|nr:dTDP-4-dehydrorhamnose reductase [Paenibacillus lignilyticus]MBP3967004.1 dTDP-4-dehydrorhamnose reductase [Paenibacillus lignilyticus]